MQPKSTGQPPRSPPASRLKVSLDSATRGPSASTTGAPRALSPAAKGRTQRHKSSDSRARESAKQDDRGGNSGGVVPADSNEGWSQQGKKEKYTCLESLAVWSTLVVDCYWYDHLFREGRAQVTGKTWEASDWAASVGRLVLLPVKMYLKYPLRWTVNGMVDNRCVRYSIISALVLATLVSLYFSVDGFMHPLPEPRSLGTLHMIESGPATPVLLLLVAHFVLSAYGAKQKLNFMDGRTPPSPALYVYLLGKAFMSIRMVVAYSASDLGDTLNFFVWEELMLIGLHVLLTVTLLGACMDLGYCVEHQVQVVVAVFVIDLVKTAAVVLYYLYYTPGWISRSFERFPTMESRISFFFLVHASCDAVQSVVTTFTLYMAKSVQESCKAEKGRDVEDGTGGEKTPLRPKKVEEEVDDHIAFLQKEYSQKEICCSRDRFTLVACALVGLGFFYFVYKKIESLWLPPTAAAAAAPTA